MPEHYEPESIRKINRGYQFTLPQSFRQEYDLQIGDYLKIYEESGKLIVEPVDILSKNPADRVKSLFAATADSFDGISEDEIIDMVRQEIKEQRKDDS